MSYVDSNLIEGEHVIYRTRVHSKPFIAPVLFALVVSVPGVDWSLRNVERPRMIPLGLAILWLLSAFIKRQTSEFVVTNKRVLMKVGVFTTRSIEPCSTGRGNNIHRA
jgi:hypothetical protein